MTHSIIQLAIRKACQSICKIRISAIAFDNHGNILTSAFNSPRFNRFGGGMHAEMKVLQKAGSKTASILICRVGHSGNLLPVHPCKTCQRLLDKRGIRVYSISSERG